MALFVKKYHNYPKAMVTEIEENKKPSELFYFCLFELSNGRKLSVHTYKSYNDKKSIYKWNTFMTVNNKGEDVNLGEYSVSYADEYNFGEEFSEWFERIPPAADVSENPKDDEYFCVIDYYEKNIKPQNT
tara:strand:- start:5292 stop:5681 length:390 start_codon:yes stop_codon:yes gene_type:complete